MKHTPGVLDWDAVRDTPVFDEEEVIEALDADIFSIASASTKVQEASPILQMMRWRTTKTVSFSVVVDAKWYHIRVGNWSQAPQQNNKGLCDISDAKE